MLVFDSQEPTTLASVASLILNLVDRVDEQNIEMLAIGIQVSTSVAFLLPQEMHVRF